MTCDAPLENMSALEGFFILETGSGEEATHALVELLDEVYRLTGGVRRCPVTGLWQLTDGYS